MVIVNWLIKATRRLVSRLIVASTSHWLPSRTSITSGMWRK